MVLPQDAVGWSDCCTHLRFCVFVCVTAISLHICRVFLYLITGYLVILVFSSPKCKAVDASLGISGEKGVSTAF